MVALSFSKVEGIGNDFLLVDRIDVVRETVEREVESFEKRASMLCDRRRGVGADGILVVGPPRSKDAAATMWVVNADGSRPEMCGNGLRCVAAFVARQRSASLLSIDTDAGLKRCEVTRGTEDTDWVRVDMGPGSDEGDVRPHNSGGRVFRRISMGNPHAIHFVLRDENPERLARTLGAALEVDAVFPARSNIEFARLEPDGSITLWVWERGCGITEACGTGACATACAAVWEGHRPARKAITIHLPGGDLKIEVPESAGDGVMMAGPARRVFEGTIDG